MCILGVFVSYFVLFFFFQAEDGIRDLVRSRGLGDVYKRQAVGLFLLALPATAVLEAIGAWLHNNRITRAVEDRTKGVRTSAVRIAYNFAYLCILLAAVIGLTAAWRAVFPS